MSSFLISCQYYGKSETHQLHIRINSWAMFTNIEHNLRKLRTRLKIVNIYIG